MCACVSGCPLKLLSSATRPTPHSTAHRSRQISAPTPSPSASSSSSSPADCSSSSSSCCCCDDCWEAACREAWRLLSRAGTATAGGRLRFFPCPFLSSDWLGPLTLSTLMTLRKEKGQKKLVRAPGSWSRER
eukprot:1538596-Rhodomonas_salina.2